ncbi:MAG: acyltransferase [Alphaproteobacteria bacterium]|nr:acyltransferase [Alphaproteobacteria bacterium]
MEKERYHNIDFLRIIFINAIIIHHFYHMETGIWNSGGYAVELFFIISGFVFNISYDKTKTVIDFIRSKLTFFLPLLIFTSTTLSIFGKFHIQKLLADLFLLQRTGLYSDGGGYNRPAWFISVLFWELLFIFCLRKNIPEKVTNLILGILTFASLIFIVNNVKDTYQLKHLCRGFSSISIGYFCAEFIKVIPSYNKQKKSIIATAFEASVLLYLIKILFSTYKVQNVVAIMLLMGILIISFSLKKGYIGSFLNKKIFTTISIYVFPIYMTHGLWYRKPFFPYIQKICDNRMILLFIIGIFISWSMGIILYHLIQVPCKRYLTNKFK